MQCVILFVIWCYALCAVLAQGCKDEPVGDGYTCAQQKKWGKCSSGWMKAGNYCAKTCGHCDQDTTSGCEDKAVGDGYSCEQQKKWGKCSSNWMKAGNYCAKTCGNCDQNNNFACGQEGSCIYGICDNVQCADSSCNARESNIEGEVLILDYNSLFYNAGPNHPLQVTNPAGCCEKCKATQGCNAWVFCSDKNGCGSGCESYVKSLPASPLQVSNGDTVPVPFPNFGQFSSCSGDKYPWLMCSLKTIKDVDSPTEIPSSGEFVSWVVKSEAGCPEGISNAVCNSCKNSTNVSFCEDCSTSVSLNDQLFCAQCTDALTTQPLKKQCVSCLKAIGGSKTGCGKCTTLANTGQFPAGAMQACFECTLGENDTATQEGCFDCFQYADDLPTGKNCSQQCAQNDAVPSFAKADCGNCYFFSNNAKRCTQCLQDAKEGNTQCDTCAVEECYTCLKNFASNLDGRKGCASCQYLDGKLSSDCFKCVNNKKVPDFAKAQCGQCIDQYGSQSAAQQQACFGCLQNVTTGAASGSCSSCMSAANGDSPPTQCYQCVESMSKRGSNGSGCSSCEYEDNADDRDACYKCMQDPKKPAGVAEQCSMCFGSWAKKGCLGCLANAKTVDEAYICS